MAEGGVGFQQPQQQQPPQSEDSSASSMPGGRAGTERRSLRAADYLAVRHALPKTYLHHTLLHENVSQDRHLAMAMARLQRRQGQYVSNFELSRRTFIDRQMKKHRKWKREDEVRASNMNFPTLRADAVQRSSETHKGITPELGRRLSQSRGGALSRVSKGSLSANAEVIYRSPRYYDDSMDESPMDGPLLPFMSVRRESTEVVLQTNTLYMTKLPTIIEIDDLKLRRYNTYCGAELAREGAATHDRRFEGMIDTLSGRKSVSPAKAPSNIGSPDKSSRRTLQDTTVSSDSLPPQAPAAPKSAPEAGKARRKSRVVFPSLSGQGRGGGGAAKEAWQHSQCDMKTSALQNHSQRQIAKDLKNKDLKELLYSYGKIRTGYGQQPKPKKSKEKKTKVKFKDIDDDLEGREDVQSPESDSDSREFKSPTLQLMFSVKSNVK